MVWGLCVCLGGYLAARGYLHLRQSPGARAQQILGDLCMETEREAYLWYMPGIFYEEGTTTPLITKLWTKIENWYPLGMYLKEHQEEEQHPVIEDESTCYEMIHANGNTIADRLLGENQEAPITVSPVLSVTTPEIVILFCAIEVMANNNITHVISRFFFMW